MKRLTDIIRENQDKKNPDSLDMDWINDDGPVITKGGYEAKIDDVDMTKIPNQLKGHVYTSDGEIDGWIWDETGKCIQCKNKFGNGYRPGDEETLLKNND